MKRYIITCPAYIASGGPELLHQLCHTLRKNNCEALMYYTDVKNNTKSPINPEFVKYGNPYIIRYDKSVHDIIILPEIYIDLLDKFSECNIFFWWLSVDNMYAMHPCFMEKALRKVISFFSGNYKYKVMSAVEVYKRYSFIYKFNNNRKQKELNNILLKNKKIYHLAQSKYAFEHVRKMGVDIKKILYLSDYLNLDFLNKAILMSEKQNVVLYNPKKGFIFTRKLIQYDASIKWIPLENLSREHMIEKLCSAKVYIDFGNHPGKDRIPREAAISGCCVITGKRGSAAYYEDVPILDIYKHEDTEDEIPIIINQIKSIFCDFTNNSKNFEEYRFIIKSQKEQFVRDVNNIFIDFVAKNKIGDNNA